MRWKLIHAFLFFSLYLLWFPNTKVLQQEVKTGRPEVETRRMLKNIINHHSPSHYKIHRQLIIFFSISFDFWILSHFVAHDFKVVMSWCQINQQLETTCRIFTRANVLLTRCIEWTCVSETTDLAAQIQIDKDFKDECSWHGELTKLRGFESHS
jgi:hypothetical protein